MNRKQQLIIYNSQRLPKARSTVGNLISGNYAADTGSGTLVAKVVNGLSAFVHTEAAGATIADDVKDVTFTMNAGQVYTYSVFAKRYVGARDFALLAYSNSFDGLAQINVSLASGAALITPDASGTFSAPSFSFVKYSKGWFLFTLKFTGAANTLVHLYLIQIPVGQTISPLTSYTGDGVSAVAWFNPDFR
jgi:hypothetical protein